MFRLIANLVTKRPWFVVILLVTLGLAAGAVGGGVTAKLTSGGFEAKSAESYQAADRFAKVYGQAGSNVILLVTAKSGTVDSPEVKRAAAQVESRLRATDHVSGVASYWSTGSAAQLKSKDSKQALILANLTGGADALSSRVKLVTANFTSDGDVIRVGVGGVAEINRQFTAQIEKDLKLAEMIALPLTFLLLVLVFRSLVAASLPVILGGFAITGSLFVLWVLTQFTSVSIYALNLTTMLGLGLAIDYSLFMVARFREQLEGGDSVDEAVAHAVERAGRMILFSGITVAISLAALLLFPQDFLRSFAYAGVAVAIISAIGSLLLLPAILKLLGRRVNSLSFGLKLPAMGISKTWERVGSFVTRHPIVVAGIILELLTILALPFLSLNLGRSDERSLPANNPVRLVHRDLRTNFASLETSSLNVVSLNTNNVNSQTIESYALKLSKVANVDHVEAATGVYINGKRVANVFQSGFVVPGEGTWLKVVPGVEPISNDGVSVTKAVRAVEAPFSVKVGGVAAALTDLRTSINETLPWVLLFICVATFVLLLLMFGSVVLPIVTIFINFFALAAVFGIVVWIFQEGHLADMLHFTANGMLEATMPILMFCVAFGLSMDYSVFLLSRIKEQYDATGDTTAAIVHGLGKTGGIITAAAVSISLVFIAFATSGVAIIKMFGLGLAIAVLLDAFVIRGTLVPAFMKLFGKAIWWAPKPLKRLHELVGLRD